MRSMANKKPLSLRILLCCCLLGSLLTTGCATTVGVIGGVAMGGTSLTKVLYDGNSSDTFKYVATVPAFIGGTVTGPFINLGPAINMDIKRQAKINFRRLFDPFQSGLF